jgi:hypothetical protein
MRDHDVVVLWKTELVAVDQSPPGALPDWANKEVVKGADRLERSPTAETRQSIVESNSPGGSGTRSTPMKVEKGHVADLGGVLAHKSCARPGSLAHRWLCLTQLPAGKLLH